jgi:hypothetical protein
MKKQKGQGRLMAAFVLVLLVAGVAALGAQEELTFSGSVISGLRYRSYVGGPLDKENVFDIDAGDDYLVEGDTATLRGALNKGFYGANFALSLNANNTQGNFWTVDRIYVSEASLWAKILNEKLRVKAGFFADFDYFTPVNAWSLGPAGGTDALQLTVYPIEGLQFDVRTKNSPHNTQYPQAGFKSPVWYAGEQFARNIDVGVRYSNPSITAFVALDDKYDIPGAENIDETKPPVLPRQTGYQTDVYAYFAYTGIPKLTVGLESKFLDLTSERVVFDDFKKEDATHKTKDVGITNITGINASYQITDAVSLRAWFVLGASEDGLVLDANELLENDGFTFTVDLEGSYKINDALTFSLRPIFVIPDTEDADIFDISVKPKLAWTVVPGPHAATINFWYKLRYYSEDGANYIGNDKESLNHTVACTFNWTF